MGLFTKFTKKISQTEINVKKTAKNEKKENQYERKFKTELYKEIKNIEKEPLIIEKLKRIYQLKITLINRIQQEEKKYSRTHEETTTLQIEFRKRLNSIKGLGTKLVAKASKFGGVSNAETMIDNIKARGRKIELELKQEVIENRNEMTAFEKLDIELENQIQILKEYLADITRQEGMVYREIKDKKRELKEEQDEIKRLIKEEGTVQELRYLDERDAELTRRR